MWGMSRLLRAQPCECSERPGFLSGPLVDRQSDAGHRILSSRLIARESEKGHRILPSRLIARESEKGHRILSSRLIARESEKGHRILPSRLIARESDAGHRILPSFLVQRADREDILLADRVAQHRKDVSVDVHRRAERSQQTGSLSVANQLFRHLDPAPYHRIHRHRRRKPHQIFHTLFSPFSERFRRLLKLLSY